MKNTPAYSPSVKISLILLLALPLKTQVCSGQDPVLSQFMFHQIYFNPAYTGLRQSPCLTAGYRNQWPGLGNSYVSYYASFDQYIDKIDGGIGVSLHRDIQGNGVFTNTGLDLAYSYPVSLSRDFTLGLGLQGGISQNSITTGGLVLPDQNPFQPQGGQEVIPSQSKFYPDFAAGISFDYREQYQAGFSVQHLNTPHAMTGSLTNLTLPVRYTFQVSGTFPSPQVHDTRIHFTLMPGFMAQMQHTSLYLNYGANLKLNAFLGGIWFRNDILLHLNTFTFLAGYSWAGIQLVYSYDLWAPKTYQQFSIYGAHEVTFIYLFKYNDAKKKMKAIKCPKF